MRARNLLALSLLLCACSVVGEVFGPRADAESSESASTESGAEDSSSSVEGEDESPIDATDVGTGGDADSEWGETGATYGDLGSTSWGEGEVSPFCLDTCARNDLCGIELTSSIEQCEEDCAFLSAQNAEIGADCQSAFEDLHFCLNTLSCSELETFYAVGGGLCEVEEQLVGVYCAP